MNLSEVNFKIAKKEDLKDILHIFEDTIRTVCKKDYSQEQIDAWANSINNKERWLKKIENQYFLLLVFHQQIIGFASLDDHGCLDLLYVHKDHQSQGLATLLLSKIESKAKELGFASIYTFGSISALPFFENNDFKILHPNSLKINEIEIKNFKLVKPLF